MKRILWMFQVAAIVLFTLPLAVLPHKIALKLGEILGSLLFFISKRRRIIAVENVTSAISRKAIITDAIPEFLVRENFRNLGKSFAEVVKMYYGLGEDVIQQVEIRGVENFRKAISKGSGLIIITGHCGNWELAGIAASLKLVNLNVVARPLDNPYLNRIVERIREKFGNRVIYKRGAAKKIFAALKRNEVVVILMDQSATRPESVIIEFLGRNAYTLKFPAMIARKSGAPVVPVFIRRVGTGHMLEIGEEIELDRSQVIDETLRNDTIRFTRPIEEYVRQNPTEWLWMHRRWKRIKD